MGDKETPRKTIRFEWVDDAGEHSEDVATGDAADMRLRVYESPGFRTCAVTDLDLYAEPALVEDGQELQNGAAARLSRPRGLSAADRARDRWDMPGE